MDNLDVSVAALRKLTENWRQLSVKQSSLEGLGDALKSFRQKNEKALTDGVDHAQQILIKNADKYCKWLLGRVSSGHGCMESFAFVVIALGVGAAVFSPNFGFIRLEETLGTLQSLHVRTCFRGKSVALYMHTLNILSQQYQHRQKN